VCPLFFNVCDVLFIVSDIILNLSWPQGLICKGRIRRYTCIRKKLKVVINIANVFINATWSSRVSQNARCTPILITFLQPSFVCILSWLLTISITGNAQTFLMTTRKKAEEGSFHWYCWTTEILWAQMSSILNRDGSIFLAAFKNYLYSSIPRPFASCVPSVILSNNMSFHHKKNKSSFSKCILNSYIHIFVLY
jgi:hypothetical protein